jgi:polyisoprenoid-binding protein YceI
MLGVAARQRPLPTVGAEPMRQRFLPITRIGAALLLASAVFIAGSQPALAQTTVFTFNPAVTTVHFTLGATLHTVHGTMQLKRGEIRFNPATGEASGEIVVDATSAQTGNQSRDGKMHREVLQSARYPEIIFTAQQVKGTIEATGTSQVQLSGTFQLNGRTHPMTLPVTIERETNGDTHTKTTFAVPYVQWGLKNPSTLFLRVNDHVDMEIDAVGQFKASN